MLEAILAARDALIVTYQGEDPRAAKKAPAAPIDEAPEVIADSAGLDESSPWCSSTTPSTPSAQALRCRERL